MTPGQKLKAALKAEKPLHLLGILNPYMGMQVQAAGFKAAYVSGAGLSYFNYGVPDVGVVALEEVCYEAKKITRIVDIPILVDADTGWDDAQKTVEAFIASGIAGLHLEDQTEDKRCGHLDGKSIVGTEEMCARIRAAVKGKTSGKVRDADFMVMARTDAFALEGMNGTISRMQAYVEAGADAIFAEAMTDLKHYDQIRAALGPNVPLLANMTEFGKTELYTRDQLAKHGVDMMLSPVTLARSMHGGVFDWLGDIRTKGSTQQLVDGGQLKPRSRYSDLLDYDPKTDNRDTILARLNARLSEKD
ncbi:MAG: methylisocitrate lyase [Proteobacteria bacterium]|nr:methylisocitrate lyase [Pseudomonadota bacterium]